MDLSCAQDRMRWCDREATFMAKVLRRSPKPQLPRTRGMIQEETRTDMARDLSRGHASDKNTNTLTTWIARRSGSNEDQEPTLGAKGAQLKKTSEVDRGFARSAPNSGAKVLRKFAPTWALRARIWAMVGASVGPAPYKAPLVIQVRTFSGDFGANRWRHRLSSKSEQ